MIADFIASASVFVSTQILPLGPLGVFLASIAEEVVAPIPSALVMMSAGFLFVSGPVDLAHIFRLAVYVGVPAGLGVAIGSLWIYGVAYWGGKPLLDKYGKWLGLYWYDVEKMKAKFEGKSGDELVIITARIIPFVPSVAISAFCGFIRMKFWKYMVLTFVGMFLRGMLMGAIGWQVGNIYTKYADMLSHFEDKVMYLIAFMVLLVIGYFIFRKYKNEKV